MSEQRIDYIDLSSPYDALMKRWKNAATGNRREDVDAAIRLLIGQIEAADRAIRVAEERHRIDRADFDRSRAEQRLAALEAGS